MTDSIPISAKPKAHHLGHRERLRERAIEGGLANLPDYELLELFLFRSQPQGDVKPLAKALLDRFGSMSGVMAASLEDMQTVRATDIKGQMRGVGKQTALDLCALQEAARRAALDEVAKRPVISSWTALLSYVRLALQHEPREQFRILYLDNKNQLIRDEIQNRGTVDHAPVYPREVVRRGLEVSAAAMILVHNHPSGDPTPSPEDVRVTEQIIEAGKLIDIEVLDHLVIGHNRYVSLKERGLAFR